MRSQKVFCTTKNITLQGSSLKRDTLIWVLPSENVCKTCSVGQKLKPFQGKLSRLKLIPHKFYERFNTNNVCVYNTLRNCIGSLSIKLTYRRYNETNFLFPSRLLKPSKLLCFGQKYEKLLFKSSF